MYGVAVNEIIIRALAEMRLCKAKLEIEESGNEVASLQGHVAGYKEILAIIASTYSLHESAIEDTGDMPRDVGNMDDTDLELLAVDIDLLTHSEDWAAIIQKVSANVAEMKDHLLFIAEKGRDLHLYQGKYKAQTLYVEFFANVNNEKERRMRKREEERRAPGLPFDAEA